MTARWRKLVEEMTTALVNIPTISPDIVGENRCAAAIARFLQRDTTLVPQHWPLSDGRHNIACLLRGEHPQHSSDTLILLGHYDTVGVDEFRPIAAPPYDPDALRAVFTDRIGSLPDDVRGDLLARDAMGEWAWLFGRGTIDMKSGLAIGIAVMRQLWEQRAHLRGNVMFIACPDEENESLGIRSAVTHLLSLRDQYDLNYVGVLNTDYTAPQGHEGHERPIFQGTIGKLLPSFYVLGVPTHVGEPFRGIGAESIASNLVQRINLNPAFCDRWHDDVTVPPVTLRMRDLKTEYNVQTAPEAFVYANLLTYTRTPKQVLAQMKGLASEAVAAAIDGRQQRYDQFAGQAPPPPQCTPTVLTFSELTSAVCETQAWSLAELDAYLAQLSAELDGHISAHIPTPAAIANKFSHHADLRDKSRVMVTRLVDLAKITGPAVVIYFSPPYYPHIQPADGALTEAVRQVIARSSAVETPTLRGFYPYISDLSFVRADANVLASTDALVANMPVFGRGYTLDFEAMRQIDCPLINLGPWGKDAHGLYERVHMPYSFETVPQLLYEVIWSLLVH